MPATATLLTTMLVDGKATLPTDAAACNECDIVLYRGYSTSEAKQFAAKHNAAVHGISKFGPASIRAVPAEEES